MKKNFLLSERESLALAMQKLHHYQTWAVISLNETMLDEESLLKYFEVDFDDPKKNEYERVLSAALNRTVYEKTYIPNGMKRAIALQGERDLRETLTIANVEYNKNRKGMTEKEANERLKNNKMIERVAFVENMAKWGTRKAAKLGISFGIGALVAAIFPTVAVPSAVISTIAYGIITLMPKDIKDPIEKGVKDEIDKVAKSTRNLAHDLSEKAVEVATYAQKVVGKITKVAKNVWEGTKKAAKKVFSWMFK